MKSLSQLARDCPDKVRDLMESYVDGSSSSHVSTIFSTMKGTTTLLIRKSIPKEKPTLALLSGVFPGAAIKLFLQLFAMRSLNIESEKHIISFVKDLDLVVEKLAT
eukprot:3993434-Ditylum_brightwellii.AAC.1